MNIIKNKKMEGKLIHLTSSGKGASAPHGPDGFGATTNRQKIWQSSSSLKY